MAGLFSARYPHLVERVTMICPACRHSFDLFDIWCLVYWLVIGFGALLGYACLCDKFIIARVSMCLSRCMCVCVHVCTWVFVWLAGCVEWDKKNHNFICIS